MGVTVTGIDEVLSNLKKQIGKIEGDINDGLEIAAKFVEGESNEMAPHDLGVLINSSFSGIDRAKKIARVGYTAKYAPMVHESRQKLKGVPRPKRNGRPNGTFWDRGEPKFLQKSIARNTKQILAIIAKRAKI